MAKGTYSRAMDVYNSLRWKTLSSRIRKERPFCSKCGVSGKERRLYVDHTFEIRDRPDLAFEESNLVVLCAVCHQQKTQVARERRSNALPTPKTPFKPPTKEPSKLDVMAGSLLSRIQVMFPKIEP